MKQRPVEMSSFERKSFHALANTLGKKMILLTLHKGYQLPGNKKSYKTKTKNTTTNPPKARDTPATRPGSKSSRGASLAVSMAHLAPPPIWSAMPAKSKSRRLTSQDIRPGGSVGGGGSVETGGAWVSWGGRWAFCKDKPKMTTCPWASLGQWPKGVPTQKDFGCLRETSRPQKWVNMASCWLPIRAKKDGRPASRGTERKQTMITFCSSRK